MRNTKLPLILVQLTNLSMLLESTVWAVCRLAVPIPSHAGLHGQTAQHISQTSSNNERRNCAGLHQCWGSSNKVCLSFWPTFGADVSTRDAHFNAVLLHLHLVAGTRSHAGAVIHHEVIWNTNTLWVQKCRWLLLLTGEHAVPPTRRVGS